MLHSNIVPIKDSSKRIRQPRSLTVEEFRLLLTHLREPFGTMALVCICFGLRISECLALRWSDVDWLNGLLRVERGIVEQEVDDAKTQSRANRWLSPMTCSTGSKCGSRARSFQRIAIGFSPVL